MLQIVAFYCRTIENWSQDQRPKDDTTQDQSISTNRVRRGEEKRQIEISPVVSRAEFAAANLQLRRG